jgi:probable rRNA maturation factor
MLTIELDQEGAEKDSYLSADIVRAAEKLISNAPKARQGTISVAYITDKRMQELNLRHRDKDETTDVLSFSYKDAEDDVLGDVVISLEQARKQAEGRLHTELLMLLVHGCLHVLGYDHIDPSDAKEMFPLQDSIIDACL